MVCNQLLSQYSLMVFMFLFWPFSHSHIPVSLPRLFRVFDRIRSQSSFLQGKDCGKTIVHPVLFILSMFE